MLVYHSLLLIYNRRKIGKFVIKSTYLNSKQLFLLKSGEISFIVFLIQFVNFFKFVLGFFLSSAYVFLLIINFFFDLYPFVLLFFYLRYTKEK